MADDTCTISVTGSASVDVHKDLTVVSFRISGTEKTNKRATRILTEQNNAVVDTVTSIGIDRKELKTWGLGVNPTWGRYTENEEGFDYYANYEISFPNDNELLSRLGDALRRTGFVTSLRFSFKCSDYASSRNSALADATRVAIGKAQAIAAAAGVKVGRILNISDSYKEPDHHRPMWVDYALCDVSPQARAPSFIDVESDDQTISATVQLEVEIIN